MENTFLNFKTDPALMESLTRAAARKMTPDEALQQRVSYVFSAIDRKSSVSREQVKDFILQQRGSEGAAS